MEAFRRGSDMKFTHMMRVVRTYLLQFKSIEDKVNHLIEVLDIVRDQDIDNYGPECSPFGMSIYNPQNEMFAHFQTKRIIFKNETQLFKVIPIPQKSQKNRPASPEFYTFEGS